MNDRRRADRLLAAICAAALFAIAGCGPKSSGGGAPKASPSPSPSPKAPPLEATVTDFDLLLTDSKGAPVARMKAKAGSVGPGVGAAGAAYQGTLLNGTATLYQEGKPAATMRADKVEADQAKRTVTGRGNVVVKSLQSAESPAIRADEMTWSFDKNKVRGRGKVLVTREPDWNIPAESFEADTQVREVTLFGKGAPATGSF